MLVMYIEYVLQMCYNLFVLSNFMKTAFVQARIEPNLKNDAEYVLGKLGIKPSEAITLFYSQIVLKKGIPFPLNLEEGDEDANYIQINSIDEFKKLIK